MIKTISKDDYKEIRYFLEKAQQAYSDIEMSESMIRQLIDEDRDDGFAFDWSWGNDGNWDAGKLLKRIGAKVKSNKKK